MLAGEFPVRPLPCQRGDDFAEELAFPLGQAPGRGESIVA